MAVKFAMNIDLWLLIYVEICYFIIAVFVFSSTQECHENFKYSPPLKMFESLKF
jgi:hypothetical protein